MTMHAPPTHSSVPVARPARAAPLVDDLAAALGRARAAHERRPDDHRLYAAMLEAEVAYLAAELARRDRALGRERMRAAEIGKRLQEARSAATGTGDAARRARLDREARDRRDARIRPGHDGEAGARAVSAPSPSLPGLTGQRPRRRRPAPAPGGVPLFDFAGVVA